MDPALPPAPTTRWKRSLRASGGFLLLVAGIPMLVMPGPGMPIIFFGLNLLAVDYPWAKRLLGRLRGAVDELQRRLPRPGGIQRARHAAHGLSRRLGRQRTNVAAPAPTPTPQDAPTPAQVQAGHPEGRQGADPAESP